MRVGIFISFVLGLAVFALSVISLHRNVPGPYFIDSSRALGKFAPLLSANQVIARRDANIRIKLKVYDDSLAKLMDSASHHRGLPEMELINLESNVLRHEMTDSVARETKALVASASDSFNVMAALFSKREGIPVLFGSSGNTVVFGTGTRADKTDDLLRFVGVKNE
ncbi:MAG: hypothetical protein WCS71_01515 [Sphaerochaetaceae bacterium]